MDDQQEQIPQEAIVQPKKKSKWWIWIILALIIIGFLILIIW